MDGGQDPARRRGAEPRGVLNRKESRPLRKSFVCGNWKMYKTPTEARALAREVANGLRGAGDDPEVVVCPAFPALAAQRADVAVASPLVEMHCHAFGLRQWCLHPGPVHPRVGAACE